MSNFFITLAVFLITVIGALFAVPYFIDWNGYRGVFEEEATRLLGREVRVGGSVNLHLLPTPYFRFEKVRIADTSANLQEPLFRSESLAIKLSIPPMFRGMVEANEIELQRPIVRLAVNDKDGWNWQSLGQLLGGAAYLPASVSLSSVRITDGVLALHGVDGAERIRFEGINGELAAPALDGPYRFRGTFGKGRAARELRVATARAEADGTVRFKATLRSLEAGSSYALDGRLADPMGKPSIGGELTAQLPIRSLWSAPQPAPRQRAEPAAGGIETKTEKGEPAFDLKAKLEASPAGATLSELALAFEQGGRPQLVTGEAKAAWRDALAVELNLASRWLDLDRMAGVSETATPLDSIVPLAIAMRDLLPGEGRSRAVIAIDQGNVGGDAVSNLRLALLRSQDNLQIEELRVGLPGGSRAELQGVVSGLPEAPAFDGSVSLRGSSLVRFLGWASANALAFDAKADGTFGFRSRLSIAPGTLAVHGLAGDVSGAAIRGAAHYRWGARPELSLVVDSPQLDARAFIPAGASLTDILDVILYGPARPGAPGGLGARGPGWRSAQTDALIRVNTGQLITASRTYRDVVMELELRGGRLKVPQLKVSGDDGFSLEVEGDLDNVAQRPKGVLRGVAGADTPRGILPLAELLGIPDSFRPGLERGETLVPLRVAGSMVLGVRTPTSADLVLDGELAGGNVRLNARLDGGSGGWRTGPADVTGLVEAADARVVAALLAPGKSPAAAGNPAPGRLLLKSSGVPAQGLASLLAVDAGDLGFRFRGKLTAAETGNAAVGEIEMQAADGTRVAALAGLAPPLRLDGVPIAGSFDIKADGASLALDRIALNVGGGLVTGQLSLAAAGDRRRVEARLDIEELSLGRLLNPLLDQRMAVAGIAEAAVAGRASPWPDEPFDAASFDAFDGNIRLKAKRLLLVDGIGLTDAALDIALARGKVDVSRIEGGCLGGRCNAALRIDKVPAGAELAGSLRIAGGALEAVAGKSAASGTLGGEIKFAGKGSSPRSAVSVLSGGGTLELGDARLAALWPGAIAVGAEAALRAEPDKAAAALKPALASALMGGQLPLPGSIRLEIADGQLSVRPFAIETAEGNAEGGASLDLRSLAFDSEWRLSQKPPPPGERAALPTVTVTYRGPVASLGRIEPRIATEALERELAVRRMERDVEELERLRKLDEGRRREEAERQRRQFEQTPAPVPIAPAVPSQPRAAAPG